MGPWNKPERRSLARGFMPRKPVDRRRAERNSSGLSSGNIDLKQRKDWSIWADKMISSRGIYISKQQIESYIESYFENPKSKSISDPSDAQLFSIDLKSFIEQINSKTKQKIAILAYCENRDDSEISKILQISRQYVNRVRREINQKLLEQYFY